MAQMYYEKDGDLAVLKGRTIGVIGFGSQGHAHALNLKDSGCDVVVGLYPGSKSWKKAEDAGLKVASVNDVARAADIIMRRREAEHPIEQVGEELRGMMAWLKQGKNEGGAY